MIAPEPEDVINQQTRLRVLLRNNLLVSALIFAALEVWRPLFFMTDDNLDGTLPFFTEVGRHLLNGQLPFVSDHLFGGHYNLLRDPSAFAWSPIYMVVSLLAGTPFHLWIIDVDAFVLFMLTTAGFITLAWYLRREMSLPITDGWIMFYTMSYVYSIMALTTGASWITFMGNQSSLPWFALGILLKNWRHSLGLIALVSLHQFTAGHPLATVSTTIFMTLFAVGVSISRSSFLPITVWLGGNLLAFLILLPLLQPMLQGVFHTTRFHGVSFADMQANNVPLRQFPMSLFLGMAIWIMSPFPHPHTTYTVALGASAAIWCLLPVIISRAKWRRLELVTVAMLVFGMILICRPPWLSAAMLHVPVLRSMRWPFREFLQFLFFLHLFLIMRPPGSTLRARYYSAIWGTLILVIPMITYPLPPTFNSMKWDRELLMTGGFDRYWAQVRPLLKPDDKIAVLISLELYEDERMDDPFSLVGTCNYAILANVVNASGYSPAAPYDQLYTKKLTYPFGAFFPEEKAALLAEHPDLKFITMESLRPLKITLSSRDGPTIDLTPFVPKRIAPPDPSDKP